MIRYLFILVLLLNYNLLIARVTIINNPNKQYPSHSIPMVLPPQTKYYDIDFDGLNEFGFTVQGAYISQKKSCTAGGEYFQESMDFRYTFSFLTPTNFTSYITNPTNTTIGIASNFSNTNIYELGTFYRSAVYYDFNNPPPSGSCTYYNNPWSCSTGSFCQGSGYLGFKMIKNGLTYFGYIKFQVNTSSGGAYLDYIAYESIPGYPIKINDTKGYYSSSDPNYNVIRGMVFNDINKNCTKDSGEPGIANAFVFTTNGTYCAYTDANGIYEMLVNGGSATYNLTIDTSQTYKHLKLGCYPSKTISVAVAGNNTNFTDKNIAVWPDLCSKLTVRISSDRRRRCFRNNTTVNWANEGGQSVSGVKVKVILPHQVKAISSVPAWSSKSGDTLFYNIGTASSFSSGKISIVDSVICWDESIRGKTVCTKAYISPKTSCSPPGWDLSDIVLSGVCEQSNYKVTLINTGISSMVDSLSYRVYLDNALVYSKKYKLNFGESKEFTIPANGMSVRVEADQHDKHPEVLKRSIYFEGCGINGIHTTSTGKINLFSNDPANIGESVSCMQILDSYDPNDKQAIPEGNFIEKNQELTYTIRFQNTGNDVAYTVVLVDTLNQNLEPGSLEIIGASHPYKFELTGKINPRMVWIFGGINLPDNKTNEKLSHGYVTFKVKQKQGLSDGTQITNKAHIYFDYNSAIITNTVVKTIGTPYPDKRLKVNSFTGPDTICTNAPLQLAVNADGLALDYKWKKEGQSLNNNQPNYYTNNTPLEASGNYSVMVRSVMDSITLTKKVVVQDAPQITNQLSSLFVCEGTAIKTGVKAGGSSVKYQWYKGQILLPGETKDSIFFNSFSASNAGQYYVKAYNGCSSANSFESLFLHSPKPDLNVISSGNICNGQVLDLTNFVEDLKQLDGSYNFKKGSISGNEVTNPVSEAGTYYVIKSSLYGCSDTAAVQVIQDICTGIDNFTMNGIKLYPVPAENYMVVELNSNEISHIEISDMKGNCVYKEEANSISQIDISHLAKGNYIMSIQKDGQNISRMISKK